MNEAPPQFTESQMWEIHAGQKNGLSAEQVRLYADPKFNDEQMAEIRYGLENGLTKEQVALYADPKFSWEQMYEICYSLLSGQTMEQVKLYADPKYSINQMAEMRTKVEMENKAVNKFEKDYKALLETPLDEIKEDIFFRPDNFASEKWYGNLQMYLAIGVCKTERDGVEDLQKALKILGYPTRTGEKNGELFLLPQRETQKHTAPRHKQDMER